jgi:sugar phosphate isomerase/epimerase
MHRRRFLQAAALGFGLPAARGVDPPARTGGARLLTSLAAYSFRDTFQKDPARLDMFRFIDYCADQGLAGAEVTSYYFPKDADDAYFLRLRRHAFLRGVALSGTAVGNNFALPKGPERDREIAAVKQWIDRAALMGTSHIRVFAGAPPKGADLDAALANCIEALDDCAALAATRGVFLGVENHGGIVAEPEALVHILKSVKNPWLGINLDTGNFHTADPYAALALCAPSAVNVQVKVEMTPKGGSKQPADLARIGALLRDVKYQGFVALEYEAAEDPWTAVPRHLADLKAMCAPTG